MKEVAGSFRPLDASNRHQVNSGPISVFDGDATAIESNHSMIAGAGLTIDGFEQQLKNSLGRGVGIDIKLHHDVNVVLILLYARCDRRAGGKASAGVALDHSIFERAPFAINMAAKRAKIGFGGLVLRLRQLNATSDVHQ